MCGEVKKRHGDKEGSGGKSRLEILEGKKCRSCKSLNHKKKTKVETKEKRERDRRKGRTKYKDRKRRR